MGVKLLSKLLKTECSDCVRKIHLRQLYGEKICIDTSIYIISLQVNGKFNREVLFDVFYI